MIKVRDSQLVSKWGKTKLTRVTVTYHFVFRGNQTILLKYIFSVGV